MYFQDEKLLHAAVITLLVPSKCKNNKAFNRFMLRFKNKFRFPFLQLLNNQIAQAKSWLERLSVINLQEVVTAEQRSRVILRIDR
jgi:hypothetical protein